MVLVGMRQEAPRHTRKAIRFPLEAPIVFSWADSGIEKQGEGRTRDISEVGTFVLSSTCPPVGIQISFKIFLPVLLGFEPQTRVEAAGQGLCRAQGPRPRGDEWLSHFSSRNPFAPHKPPCE